MSLKRKADHLDKEEEEKEESHGYESKITKITPVLKRPRRSPVSASPPRSPPHPQHIIPAPTQFLKLPPPVSSRHSSVPFQKPSILTTFSYTSNRELVFDNSALKYFVQPPLRADLGHRYSTWTNRPEEKGRLDSLLRAVARSGAAQSLSQGVVTWRGVMCKYATLSYRIRTYGILIPTFYERMIVAPYEESEGWSINVMQLNGVLYFEQHLTDAQLEAKYVTPSLPFQ